jgi:beta-lactamase class A
MSNNLQLTVSEIDKLGCNYAFYFRQKGAPAFFQANAERFISASLIKVPILLAWLELEKQGLVDRDALCSLDSVKQVHGAGFSWQFKTRSLVMADALLMMIATSDNLCANLVIRRAGMEALNQQFRQLGLNGCELRRNLMDFEARRQGLDNWITPPDCTRLFELIEDLPPAERNWVDSCLLATTDNGLFKRNLPREAVHLCHKTGSIPGVLHDWGYTPGCQIFLLMNGVKDEPAAFEVFGQAGKLLAED